MKKFSEIAKEKWPDYNIRITVGDTQTFLGTYCYGLEELSSKQVKWLDSHKPLRIRWGFREIEFIYRKNINYERIVWG